MKVIMIFDQIQAGAGTKDDTMIPLSAKKEPLGPSIMMEPYLKEMDAHIMACLYCGNGTYIADVDEVTRKLVGMVKKLSPDIVICGPAFNYTDYASMAAKVAYEITASTNIAAFAAMSEENQHVIETYKHKICIIKSPKKGDPGLNTALKHMCILAKALYKKEDIEELKKAICF